jgi:hypothetical protein
MTTTAFSPTSRTCLLYLSDLIGAWYERQSTQRHLGTFALYLLPSAFRASSASISLRYFSGSF